ncbi:transposase, IS605 OrfB family, central region [Streptomyces mirabilis]|uniref:Transposase, IS605 OrfB family, central region n=1 Tax=Streptomyces mirabilis TaxID=68239 RepID=A0A1I2KX23_9ACTN|nr:transposase, IS605 OrfB family, central region [Streptomyces mirabilis]
MAACGLPELPGGHEPGLRLLPKGPSAGPVPQGQGIEEPGQARIKAARQHAKVTDRRRDFHHKASTQIIRDSQAVYVEDLAVSGLGRTRLAKSVRDAGWSAFLGMLEYKAVGHGRTFAKADRAFPSSQVCSACGFRDGPKPLHVRERTCGECGTVHGRNCRRTGQRAQACTGKRAQL